MKVVTVVGARPQLVKAAAVSRVLRRQHREVLVHTGQHYDRDMSEVFFDELQIPSPDVNLGVGSGSHGVQTGAMLAGVERVLQEMAPDWVIVYGDTNSTVAGALAASKLRIRTAHVEAGLRSFNRSMAEEINRVVTDHISDLLLCPSATAVQNLAAEGIRAGVHCVGDVMLDALMFARSRSAASTVVERFGLSENGYVVATVHRAENTDDAARLRAILSGLAASEYPVVFPVHPRTRKALGDLGAPESHRHVALIEPLGYLDMVRLVAGARLVATDSGGLQKEAYWLGVPCVTLRDETEWLETVQAGWNRVVGADADRIREAVRNCSAPAARPALYGGEGAAERCVTLLEAAGAGA